MFGEISDILKERMQLLEQIDRQDRTDGTPRSKRLRQISEDTGKFLAILAVNIPAGEIIEIGTSAGYSTIWLALAAKQTGRKVKTYEMDASKAEMARETFRIAGLEDDIELIEGNFFDYADGLDNIAFCFLDAEKDIYDECFQRIASKLVKNGLIVADNAIDQYEGIKPMIDRALADERFDCVTVPVGNGEFVCRRK